MTKKFNFLDIITVIFGIKTKFVSTNLLYSMSINKGNANITK